MKLSPAQAKAIGEVCYLPDETIHRGSKGSAGVWTWKLTVNAGFE